MIKMNCCNDKHDGKHNHGKGHMSHLWMMLLCCGVPILIFLMLPLIASILPGAGSLSKMVPYLCPLLMLIMMPMMLKKSK